MKTLCLLIVAAGAMSLLSACETKVVNQPPAANGQPTVIERDQPVVNDHDVDRPPVQNNIHVDR